MLTMNLGLHVIKNPAGTYSYVGNIPVKLGYCYRKDGSDLSIDDQKKIVQCGLIGAFRDTIKVRVFGTKEDAISLAESYGFFVKNK